MLAPPLLNGVIPAFYGNTITIPFTMSNEVGESSIIGFSIRIKSLQTNSVIYENDDISLNCWNKKDMTIVDKWDSGKKYNFIVGSHYKIQLAYIDKDENIGNFSTVAIAKYTSEPKITVELKDNNPRNILGCYSNDDASEKLYSSYFTIYDSFNNIFFQSEEKIHNSFNDDIFTATEQLNLIKTPLPGVRYNIVFHCKTINEIEKSSEPQTFIVSKDYPIEENLSLNAILDFDEGRIEVILNSTSLSALNGKYKLARSSSLDGYDNWTELLDYEFINEILPCTVWFDNTIEQGVNYQYAFYKYTDSGFYSSKIISDIVFADFEDMFLSDGERQLKIRYNPKVNSIKNTIQESKQETIGGKYPFIFRNGYINYKEFPISGLISHLQDNKELFYNKTKNFITEKDSNLINFSTTNQTSENIYNERKFKMDVLEWLTNGKPKVFRTPAEGNYIVQLMNVSLSPLSDGLTRMIHTFSSTAYEINDFTLDKLLEYNFINSPIKMTEDKIFKKFNLHLKNNYGIDKNLLELVPQGAEISELEFQIYSGISSKVKINDTEITAYSGLKLNGETVLSINKIDNIEYGDNDIIIISYYIKREVAPPSNGIVTSIIENTIPCYQAFGQGDSINLLHSFISYRDKQISNMFYCHIKRSPTIDVYIKDEDKDEKANNVTYYKDNKYQSEVIPIPGLIYCIRDKENQTVRYQISDLLNPSSIIYTYNNAPSTLYAHYTNSNGVGGYYSFENGSSSNGAFISGNLKSIEADRGLIVEIGCRFSQFNYDKNVEKYQNYEKALKTFSSANNSTKISNDDIWVTDNNTFVDYRVVQIGEENKNKTVLEKLGDRALYAARALSTSLSGG